MNRLKRHFLLATLAMAGLVMFSSLWWSGIPTQGFLSYSPPPSVFRAAFAADRTWGTAMASAPLPPGTLLITPDKLASSLPAAVPGLYPVYDGSVSPEQFGGKYPALPAESLPSYGKTVYAVDYAGTRLLFLNGSRLNESAQTQWLERQTDPRSGLVQIAVMDRPPRDPALWSLLDARGVPIVWADGSIYVPADMALMPEAERAPAVPGEGAGVPEASGAAGSRVGSGATEAAGGAGVTKAADSAEGAGSQGPMGAPDAAEGVGATTAVDPAEGAGSRGFAGTPVAAGGAGATTAADSAGAAAIVSHGPREWLRWTLSGSASGTAYVLIEHSGSALSFIAMSADGKKLGEWTVNAAAGANRSADGSEPVYAIPPRAVWKYAPGSKDIQSAIPPGFDVTGELPMSSEAELPASDWRSPLFGDSVWRTGAAPFGWRSDAKEARRLQTALPAKGALPSVYFRKSFTLNTRPEDIKTMRLVISYEDGFAAYMNGSEIARRSLSGGLLTPYTLADPNEAVEQTVIDLNEHTNKLKPGVNILSVEVHRSHPNAENWLFDASLEIAK
ncbi:hypothetical protein [Paenibacillus hamazuiensis]|uniref:hypothetical protein n=1 Tax=Paenibacillus hamazuiensis TaxID=2936508 RepID=UPI00200FF815|nr:hypothetical protein [Paenibacillus hamazuiensis]